MPSARGATFAGALIRPAHMRLEGRERWTLVLPQAAVLTVLVYVVFHRFLTIPWPATFIGLWFPALKAIPSV